MLTRGQRRTVAIIVGLPLLLQIGLVWLPAAASVGLSFTSWNGVGGLSAIEGVGLKNYADLATVDPAFWPAVLHKPCPVTAPFHAVRSTGHFSGSTRPIFCTPGTG